MGGDFSRAGPSAEIGCFNPRLRMGGDERGADLRIPGGRFNPRLRMGGDCPSITSTSCTPSFNPRLRMGGDPSTVKARPIHVVSIHASAWEATFRSLAHALSLKSFNPRLRMGGDIKPRLRLANANLFQSTPPHGRRPVWIRQDQHVAWFQSTPPAWEATRRLGG